MRLELPARPTNLSLARAAVAAFAAQLPFTVEDLDDLKVALSEAVSNVILHAYPGGAAGDVIITAEIQGEDRFWVCVEDRGCGIADIAKAREPAYTTVPDRMGLGFALMENFMDQVQVESAPGKGTRVTMSKRVPNRMQGGTAVTNEPERPESTL